MLLTLAVLGVPAAAGGDGLGRLTCRLADERVTESSGVASTSWSDDVVWTHNDSGDRPRFFAVETPTCRVRAVYDVTGARAIDWEDMARSGTTLHFADIGDNDARRESVTIYDVPEPIGVDAGGGVRPSAVRVLRYPDGAHEAESVFVDPGTGRLAIVTKAFAGDAAVYLAPRNGNGEVERVGAVPVNLATGADARPGRIIVRDYLSAYEWNVRPGETLAATLEAAPEPVALPVTGQGEAIAYSRDGSGIWTTSERRGGPGEVHFVPRHEQVSRGASDEDQPRREAGLPVAVAVPAGVTAALTVAVTALARRRSAVRSHTNG